ncbi:MAG TPA: arsenic resistance N-acetyltransferase ArsN2 [Candidatus Elarobacter sp.]|nr:arsenic resistance N-acetyltransferase ArsN2 [Candidatus Elarobacter sp.]
MATAADLDAIERLLTDCNLPTDGVRDALDNFLIVGESNTITGVIGLELFGTEALLRSAAVASTARGTGIGSTLVDAIVERARSRGVRDLYLLTTTAESYFARRGFARIGRDDAAESVKQSVEFRSACPASATVMVRSLDANATA